MRQLLQDAQMRPRIMAQELGGVPAGGGYIQSGNSSFDPRASVSQLVAPPSSGGGGGAGFSQLAGAVGDKYKQHKEDYAPVKVDWNAQSDKNALSMENMYAQELANPTGMLPAGHSAPSMVGLPQGGGSPGGGGMWSSIKGFFGGGAK